jgi:hypothetical protein
LHVVFKIAALCPWCGGSLHDMLKYIAEDQRTLQFMN